MHPPEENSPRSPPEDESPSEFRTWATECIRKTNAQQILTLIGETGAVTRGMEICWSRPNGHVEYRPIALGDLKAKNSPNNLYWNEPTAALLTAFCIGSPLAEREPAAHSVPICRVGANQAKHEGRLGATLDELRGKKWFGLICADGELQAERKKKMMLFSRSAAARAVFVRRSNEGFERLNAADLGTLREQWSQRFDWTPPRRVPTEGQATLELPRLIYAPPNDQPDPAAHGHLFGARKRALTVLQEKLRAPGSVVRALIHGPVGAGKTRVAFELFQALNRTDWTGRQYDAMIWLAPRDFESYPSAEIELRQLKVSARAATLQKRLLHGYVWEELAAKVGLTHRDHVADVESLGDILEREFSRRIFFVDNVASDLIAELPFFRGADVVLTSPFAYVPHRSDPSLLEISLLPPILPGAADEELLGLFDPAQTGALPMADLALLHEFSRRVQDNPLALVEFGFRARNVAGNLQENESRYVDDSSLATEVGIGGSDGGERIRDTYAGRWRSLIQQWEKDSSRADYEQLKLLTMFCPQAVPLEQIRTLRPSFASKSFLRGLYHRRIAHQSDVKGSPFLSFTPFVSRVIRRMIFAREGRSGLVGAAQQAITVLVAPLRGTRPVENAQDPEDDRLINTHLAVLLRCFELDLDVAIEDVGRLVRHCCHLLEHRSQPLKKICRSVCPDFPEDGVAAAKLLLTRHAEYLARLSEMRAAAGTGPSARARRDVLAWERARNLDEQAVAALARAGRCGEPERTAEFRRARVFDDEAVEAIREVAAAQKRRTGKSVWNGLNLERWCSLTHAAGVSDKEALNRSLADLAAVIALRHEDLGTERFSVIMGRGFRWSKRVPGISREVALHYLADDYLALAIIANQAGDPAKTIEVLSVAWRLAREPAVRRQFPRPYALTAAVLLLAANAAKATMADAKRFVSDAEIQNAARKLLISVNDRWRFSRVANIEELSRDLDKLGIL